MYKNNPRVSPGGDITATRASTAARHTLRATGQPCSFAIPPCADGGGIVGTGVIYGPASSLA